MKNKIFSLIMAIIMIFGVFSSVLAYAEKDTSGESQDVAEYNYRAQLLSTINVAEYVSLSEAETKQISRGEFAKSVAAVMNITGGEDDRRIFADVPPEHWAASAVNYLAQRGFVSVGDDRMFNPGDYITGNEALKILLEAAGYGIYANAKGGYPTGYVAAARRIDIPTKFYTGDFTYDKFVNLVYEVVTSPTIAATGVINGELVYEETEDTLLSVYHKMYEGDGIVEATDVVSLKNNGEEGENRVVIDGVRYKTEVDFFDSLGRYINFIYKSDMDGDTPEIILWNNDYEDTDTFEISAEDYEGYNETSKEISYYGNNDKLKKVRISSQTTVVRNGKIEDENIKAALNNVNKGIVRFVDGDRDGKYEYVFIMDYVNYVVDFKDEYAIKIYDKIDRLRSVTLDKNEKTVKIYDASGNKISFDDIKAGDVLSVFESANMVMAYVSSQVNTVEIFEITQKNDTLEINAGKNDKDKQWYTVDKDFYNECYANGKSTVKAGTKADIYTDHFGKIAYIKSAGSDGWKFAYLVKTIESEGFKNMALGLYTEDGVREMYYLADKVKVDGISLKDENKIYNSLKKSLYGKTLSEGEDDVNGQLIRVRFNKNGEISEIDTERELAGEDSNQLYRSDSLKSLTFKYNACHFEGFFPMNGDTIIFGVPKHTDLENSDEEDFIIANASAMTEQVVTVEGFKVNLDNGYEDVVVIYNPSDFLEYQYAYYLIENVYQKLVGEDDIRYVADGYYNGVKSELVAAEGYDFDGARDGDLIQIKRDIHGDVAEVKFLNDYVEPENGNSVVLESLKNDHSYNGYYNNYASLIYGYLKSYNDGVFGISWDNPADDLNNRKCDFSTKSSSCAVMIYDHNARKNKVSLGTTGDLMPAALLGSEAQPYFYCAAAGVIKSVIIYK